MKQKKKYKEYEHAMNELDRRVQRIMLMENKSYIEAFRDVLNDSENEELVKTYMAV